MQRYEYRKKKTKLMMLNPRIKRTTLYNNNSFLGDKMGDKVIDNSTDETHLDMRRTPDGKARCTVDGNISKARKTAYALVFMVLMGFIIM